MESLKNAFFESVPAFTPGDRILAQPAGDQSILNNTNLIFELEVIEQSPKGYIKVRPVGDSRGGYASDIDAMPGYASWVTAEGKDAKGEQVYNFIDVIPLDSYTCPDCGHSPGEPGRGISHDAIRAAFGILHAAPGPEPIVIEAGKSFATLPSLKDIDGPLYPDMVEMVTCDKAEAADESMGLPVFTSVDDISTRIA